jgi:outer membrane protein TolC
MNILNKTVMILLVAISIPVFAQQAENNDTLKSADGTKSVPMKIKLNLHEVIQGVIDRNLDMRKAAVDYDNAGSDLAKFQGQYDTYIFGSASKSYRQMSPENPAVEKEAYRYEQYGIETGVQKHFSSGTTLQASIASKREAITPYTAMPNIKLRGYNSEVNIGLSQELLKNAFGVNERRMEESLEMGTEIKQRAARQAVADAVMNSFISYWNVIIASENLKTAQIAYNNTKDIRNLVKRKSAFGISEKEELFDWEGRVLQFKNMQDGAQLGYMNSRLAILRALDLDRNTEIELTQDLNTDPPDVTFEVAIRDAFRNRTDLANLRAALRIAENSLDIAKGKSLPSVTASAGIGYNDYDPDSLSGSFNTYNKQWKVGITVSKAIGGTSEEADMADTKNMLLKRQIELRQLESGIRDEIQLRVAQCETTYNIYKQTAQASEYSRAYYERIYNKFSQGRYETTQLKLAFDNYIMQRNNVLKSLVDYNVALLQLDIARNTVFEKYHIDVKTALEKNAGKPVPSSGADTQ